MNNLMNNLFGVLNVDYCSVFLALSAWALLVTLISGLLLILNLLKIVKLKGYSPHLLSIAVNSAVCYLMNRLYYSMCVKSLHSF